MPDPWTPSDWVAERRVIVDDDPAAVAHRVAKRLASKLSRLTADSAVAHISLTGGGAGIQTLRDLAARSETASLPWDRIHVWWSDERFVPAASDERNERQAREALLDRVPIPPENVHAMPSTDTGLTAEQAAEAYSAELAASAPSGADWPSFDVCLLGVGPDAHIASLFPDRPEILVTDSAVVPVFDSPKPPPVRISLTRPVINSSKRLWLVLTGAEKASALSLALAGASYASVPAAGAKARKRTSFFVDRAAAADVPEELLDRA